MRKEWMQKGFSDDALRVCLTEQLSAVINKITTLCCCALLLSIHKIDKICVK